MSRTLRSLIAILLLACQAAVAFASPDKVRLQLKWFHQFQFAGYYMALEKGFYRDAGLDVEILEGGSHEQHYVDNMLAGKTEFAVASSDVILDRAAGKPVVALAAITQTSPGVLLVHVDSGIYGPLDLAGKRVTLSESAEVLAMLHKEGIALEKINVQPRSIDGNLDDLVNGRTDAYFGYITNEAYQLKLRGVPYRVLNPRNFGIMLYNDVLVTSERLLRDHPDNAAAFVRASQRGWEYALSHIDETVQFIHRRYAPGKSLGQLDFEARELYKLIMPELVRVGHMNPERWRRIAETYAELGMMKPQFDLNGFLYDPDPPARDLTWLYLSLTAALTVLLAIAAVSFHIIRINRRLAKSLSGSEEIEAARQQAMEALRVSEEKHRILLDESSDPIFSFYPDGQYHYVNRQFAKGLGKEPEEIIGRKIWDIFPGEEGDKRFAVVKDAFEKGESQVIEVRVPTPEGDRYLITTVKPILDDSRQVISVICISKDITERKRAETDTSESLSLLNATLESTNDAILAVDRHNNWMAYNRRFIDLWQIPDEIIAAKDDEAALSYVLNQVEDADGFLNKVRELYVTPEANSVDIINFKDGRAVERYSIPQRIDSKVVGRVWSFHDITERKVADEAFRDSERKLQMVLDNAADAVFIASREERWTYINEQAVALLGYSREEITNTSMYDIVPPSFREAYRQELAKQKTGDKVWQREIRLIRKDGSRVPAELNAVRLPDGSYYGSCRDITERKILGERLAYMAQVQAVADERQRIMQDMHDGFGSQLISSLIMVEHGRSGPAEIAQLLRECIDDLRLTIDALTPDADAEYTDLLSAFGTLRQRLEPRLHPAGIALNWHQSCSGDTLSVAPRVALQVLRIVQEAICNVVKHANAKAIQVIVTADAAAVGIRIADDGKGFNASAPAPGRGIGSMKKRMRELGGTLDLSSSGAGTQLHLSLPRPAPG